MEKNEFDKIELRSEKVRNIIGVVPPVLVRLGISIIVFLFVILVVAAYYIPYSQNIKAEVLVTMQNQQESILIFIPYKYLNEVNPGMNLQVEFEGYPSNTFGFVKSKIISKNNDAVLINDKQYFIAKAFYPSITKYDIRKNMKGTASILISNESILKRLF